MPSVPCSGKEVRPRVFRTTQPVGSPHRSGGETVRSLPVGVAGRRVAGPSVDVDRWWSARCRSRGRVVARVPITAGHLVGDGS